MLDFLGIGAQKAGTTWVYENLKRHPNVRFPAGKEVHFWDQNRERGIDWWKELFEPGVDHVKQGEFTPAYAMLDEPTIAEIGRHYPDVRLIYSLRNPIERAWSSAMMAIVRAEMLEPEASDQWFIDHFMSRGSRARGDYEQCLRKWWALFPREQMRIVFYEDIASKPRQLLEGLARHIGVDPAFFDRVPQEVLRRRELPGLDMPIRPSLFPTLLAEYGPKIERLSKLLGRDLSHWKTPRTGG